MECEFCTNEKLATVSVMHLRDRIEQAACGKCANDLSDEKWVVTHEFDTSIWDFAGQLCVGGLGYNSNTNKEKDRNEKVQLHWFRIRQ